MGARGPAPSATVVKLREGNPGDHALPDTVQLPAAYLPEPDWTLLLPQSKPGVKPTPPERDEEESIEHFANREAVYYKRLNAYEAQRKAYRGTAHVRKRAQEEWRRVVPVLYRAVGLADVDYSMLEDYCICVGRLENAEQDLAREGVVTASNRGGFVKNPLTTVTAQYRGQIRTYIGQLGLSPAARVGLPGKPDDDDDDDLFDA